ncbi:facilitated trehalose transporter Tret1-like [Anthonomus grandis grandis]|uniref:facilitated trehalose transporter Tret1-like n=1 Tax=Anthonomus grandis grandis TaxID=2921223 RepID=UPI00216634EC|nr:facilitated trehalose transporter Tret1-like [Anthonomus grandis grandis]
MTDKQRKPSEKNIFIYFAALTASLASFAMGMSFAWASPFIPKFQSDDPVMNPIGRPTSQLESTWIVSAFNVGMIFGPLVTMIGLRCFTKKTMLIVAITFKTTSNVMCLFASEVYIFIIARVLMGIGTGCIYSLLNPFIGEISEDSIRGSLGLLPGTTTVLGNLFTFVVGPLMSLKWFSLVSLIPLLIFYVCFGLFVPDTPYDLVMHQKPQQAAISLRKLRQRDDVETEMLNIISTIESRMSKKVYFTDVFRDYNSRKALALCISLMVIQQLSGITAILSYAEVIFNQTARLIPSSLSAATLSLGGLLGNLCSVFLVDRLGRKILLTASSISLCTCLISIGTYFYLYVNQHDVSSINWLPTISLMLFMTSYNIGMSNIPWLFIGEVFHSKVKPVAATMVTLSNCVSAFIVCLCFPYMLAHIGMAYTYWVFACVMLLGVLYSSLVLPETKCKSFQEIQKMLGRS